MDDVWERMDLIKVGIPMPNQENGCKLIFTTRSVELCGQMGACKKIKVECLGEDDAWKLFEMKVGEENLDSHQEIRMLAKQVAAKCGGLPLALCTIGRAMASKKMPQDWKYAIEGLKGFPHKLARMDKEVYSLLKFSYDSLPNDTMRSCFLYFCLYPEDMAIRKTFIKDYWFCEGVLDEFDNISRARMQGNNIITCLLNACLLETCEGIEDLVKMHDVIRDMALWIAGECEAPEKKYYVPAGLGSIEVVLDVKNWEGARMSLADNGIEELRGTPACPNLQTLFLSYNKLRVISDGFFQFMPSLRVLNLTLNIKLKKLPEEISQLVSLECLDLKWTGIMELPINLNRLSKLKCLNLLGTPYLKKIPRQLICDFSKLQIFEIAVSSNDLDELDEDNVLRGGNEDLIEELECLHHLESLGIEIKNDFALERFLSSLKLLRCTEKLSLSVFWESKKLNILPLGNMERLQALVFVRCKMIEEMTVKTESELGVGRMIPSSMFCNTPLFDTLSKVIICGCDEVRELTWLILPPNLTFLVVMRCSKLEEIVSEGKLSEVIAALGGPYPNPFAKLERAVLGDLPKLKSIYWGALRFSCLRQLKVFNCSSLKKLPLNLDSAKGNQIKIEGYQEWWDGVEWEDEATRNCFLPSFKCAYWWKDMQWEAETCINPPLFT